MTRLASIALITGILIAGLTGVTAQQASQADKALAAANHKATVVGDPRGAIDDYKRIVDGAGTNRALAAEALLRMAECHQMLGEGAEARQIYARIVGEYSDQTAVLASARTRLAAPSGGGGQTLAVRSVPSDGFNVNSASMSADGRWISSVTRNHELLLRDMTTGAVRVVTGQPMDPETDTIYNPVPSRDGKHVAYTFNRDADVDASELRILATNGTSQPVTLLRGDDDGSEIVSIWPWAWSPDGKAILTEVERPDGTWQLLWVSVADGARSTLKSLDWRRQRPRNKMRISLSPDGRYVAYAALVNNPSSIPAESDSSEKRVYVLASDASAETELTNVPGRAEMPVWTADGSHLLMISDDVLWAVPMAAGKPVGSVVVVTRGLSNGEPLGMSLSGIYYYRETPVGVGWLSIRDAEASGVPRATATGQQNFGTGGIGPLWSPTGERISYLREASATEPATAVVRSVERGTEKTFRGLRPVAWFRDGKHLLVKVDSRTAVNGRVVIASLSFGRLNVETGERSDLPVPPMYAAGVLSSDDKTLYVSQRLSVLAFDLATGEQRVVYRTADPLPGDALAVSPDGRWLAVKANKAIVQVAEDGSSTRVMGTLPNRVTQISWTRDGRAVLATTATHPVDSPIFRIDVDSGAVELTGRSGPLNVLSFSSLSPDGSRVVLQASSVTGAKPELFAIDNVSAFLKAAK